MASAVLAGLFESTGNVHGDNTRASGRNDLIIPVTHTLSGAHSFAVFGSKNFNLLPNSFLGFTG